MLHLAASWGMKGHPAGSLGIARFNVVLISFATIVCLGFALETPEGTDPCESIATGVRAVCQGFGDEDTVCIDATSRLLEKCPLIKKLNTRTAAEKPSDSDLSQVTYPPLNVGTVRNGLCWFSCPGSSCWNTWRTSCPKKCSSFSSWYAQSGKVSCSRRLFEFTHAGKWHRTYRDQPVLQTDGGDTVFSRVSWHKPIWVPATWSHMHMACSTSNALLMEWQSCFTDAFYATRVIIEPHVPRESYKIHSGRIWNLNALHAVAIHAWWNSYARCVRMQNIHVCPDSKSVEDGV